MSDLQDLPSEDSEGLDIAANLAGTIDLTATERQAAEEALHLIQRSVPFRSSKQCQTLLRYVVQHSLSGESNLLRERVIGTEVFGRPPDYDTANDPIVRARMAEVRKRLAQFYQSAESDPLQVHVEILPGHYQAHFRFPADSLPGNANIRKSAIAELETGNRS